MQKGMSYNWLKNDIIEVNISVNNIENITHINKIVIMYCIISHV